jgi:PTH1 family peptidyl-tRNA hydrolase
VAGQEVLLARPQTYMNLSGRAVKALAGKFRVKPEDIIVVYDDFDLPLGRIRIRPEGGPGGHNGMKSIIAELGSRSFVRVRVGIGQPGSGGLDLEEDEIIGYVLSGFNREERKVIDEAVPVVSEALLAILADGVTEAMNTYNRKNGQ